jgi:hypothetical protein
VTGGPYRRVDAAGEHVDDRSVGENPLCGCLSLPRPIRPRGNLHALLAQGMTSRLDPVAIRFHLIDESD